MCFQAVVDALQQNSVDSLVARWQAEGLPDELRDGVSNVRHANWFSGVGMSLLQLVSFLEPELAPTLLTMGVRMDLHSACTLGDVEAIAELLDADPQGLDQAIDTYYPIQFALRHPAALRYLLKHGDDANRPIRKLAWFEWEDQAAEQGLAEHRLIHMVALGRGAEPHTETAAVLLEFGADLSAPSRPFGDAPLHLAAIYDRSHLIRWFVDHGVEVDLRTSHTGQTAASNNLFDDSAFAPFDTHGQTALMLALGEGQVGAVHTLIDCGADSGARDAAGFAPLHYAAGAFWSENVELVQLLLEQAASSDVTDREGRRAADLADAKGYAETSALLAAS